MKPRMVTRLPAAAILAALVRSRKQQPEEFDLELSSGRVHVRRFGSPGASPVLCLPGLVANAVSFDFVAERLGGGRWQVISLDLRGRGRSEVSPAGTYGWPKHARDVLEAASRLGFSTFTLVGHSMGAFVAMQAAQVSPKRLDKLVLVDGAGVPDSSAAASIASAGHRPGRVYLSTEDYLEAVEGTMTPWNGYWQRYFLYDLVPVAGGVKVRTDRTAILEDVAYGGIHDPADLWPSLTMPTLLLRARHPVGGGFVVAPGMAEEFRRRVPQAIVEGVDSDHYGILMSPQTVAALKRFLGSR